VTAPTTARGTTGPTTGRPPLPKNAGMNTIQLDLELTRSELASTLDDIFATFNPRVQIRSHPVAAVGVLLAVAAAAAGAVALLIGKRRRDG
jgi:hypothetical protein